MVRTERTGVESKEARELHEAARELQEAAREMSAAARSWMRLQEPCGASEDLPEGEADQIAVEAVHEVRRRASFGAAGGFDRGPVTPEEAGEWARRREERRKREGYRPV